MSASSKSRIFRMLSWAVLVILLALGIDVISGYFLFFYQKMASATNVWAPGEREYLAYSPGATPSISVVRTLVHRLNPDRGKPASTPIKGDDTRALLSRDEELGYSARPGSYIFVFARSREGFQGMAPYHDWAVTIREDRSRATSRTIPDVPNAIHIFGASWIFGWALDDEFTLGWQLQSEYRDHFRVYTHAAGGWGHLQALLNFRRLRDKLTQRDIVLFSYAQFLLPRNAPQPSVVRSLSQGLIRYGDGPERPLLYPRATISGSRIGIDLLPLNCAMTQGYCDQPEKTLEELEDLTIRLFDEIIETSKAKLIVLHMDGPDDKVIRHLRDRNVTVVDGRAPAEIFVKDTLAPYDAHPGPINNHYWFTKLRLEIDRFVQPNHPAVAAQERDGRGVR